MNLSRRDELLRMADPGKWPDWAMVIYKCGVTVEESLQLLQEIGNPKKFELVRQGIERYTGKKVRHKFVPWRWHVCSIYTLEGDE